MLTPCRRHLPRPQGKRETLRHAVNLLANGQLARYFTAWRADASAMVLKRAVFARKQAALREALRIGDAIIRRRRWAGCTGGMGAWYAQDRMCYRRSTVLNRVWVGTYDSICFLTPCPLQE